MDIAGRLPAVVAKATPNLVLYQRARQALEEANRIDEVQDIRNKTKAMEAYALQAQDKQFAIMAAEITRRAERKLGKLIIQMREENKLSSSGGSQGRKLKDEEINEILLSKEETNRVLAARYNVTDTIISRARHGKYNLSAPLPRLRDFGINRGSSAGFQKSAMVPEKDFEDWIKKHKKEGIIPTERSLHYLAVKYGAAKITTNSAKAVEGERQFIRLQKAWDNAWPLTRQRFRHWIEDQIEQPTEALEALVPAAGGKP